MPSAIEDIQLPNLRKNTKKDLADTSRFKPPLLRDNRFLEPQKDSQVVKAVDVTRALNPQRSYSAKKRRATKYDYKLIRAYLTLLLPNKRAKTLFPPCSLILLYSATPFPLKLNKMDVNEAEEWDLEMLPDESRVAHKNTLIGKIFSERPISKRSMIGMICSAWVNCHKPKI
ncbi:unnamed protein product [Linum trigynum]|uniref:Uncharacterized protein n=1 Tax=Linum trigynum TaxID=586398 RepID=A0AAV2FF96_9ROSI